MLEDLFASQLGKLRSEMEANFVAAGAGTASLQAAILQELRGIRRALGTRDDPANKSSGISFSPVKDSVGVSQRSERKASEPAKESARFQPVFQQQEGAETYRVATRRGQHASGGGEIVNYSSQSAQIQPARTEEWPRRAQRVVSDSGIKASKAGIRQSSSVSNIYELSRIEQRSPLRRSVERTRTPRPSHTGGQEGPPKGNTGHRQPILMTPYDGGAMAGDITVTGAGVGRGKAAQALLHALDAVSNGDHDGHGRSRLPSIARPKEAAYVERLEVLSRGEAQADLAGSAGVASLQERMAALRNHQISAAIPHAGTEIVFKSVGRTGSAFAPLHEDKPIAGGEPRRQRGTWTIMQPESSNHI